MCSPDGFRWWRAWSGMSSSAPWRASMSSTSRRVRRCSSAMARAFRTSSRAFAPAASVPYLADMAALEWAWHSGLSRAPMPCRLPLAGARGRGRSRRGRRAHAPSLARRRALGLSRSCRSTSSTRRAGDVPPSAARGRARMRWWRGRGSRSSSAVCRKAARPFILALKEEKSIGEAAHRLGRPRLRSRGQSRRADRERRDRRLSDPQLRD